MTRHVFAHFMVGNTYPYSAQDWLEDIELAHTAAIDGFVLNVGKESWQIDRVADCFEAASQTPTPFYFFMSFDMSSIPAKSVDDVRHLSVYLERFGKSDRMFRYTGKVVVSTFAGENSFFGYTNLNEAWHFVKERLAETIDTPVHYVPSLFINPLHYRDMTCLDGVFNWNGGWPLHLDQNSPRHEIECSTLDSDHHHIIHLNGRTFMAAVSPWFFTHYGPDSWNKNWIYRGDDWLFVRRWEQLISMRDKVDIVQIISWNGNVLRIPLLAFSTPTDYGESHYIGPIKGGLPNCQAWVNGFPHDAWLNLTAHYSRIFKHGRHFPVSDRIFMWARPHPKRAVATLDTVPRPDNWNLTDDCCWVVVFATSPAKVVLYAGDDDGMPFLVKEGVTKLSRPLKPGRGMKAVMTRNSAVAAQCLAPDFCFEERPLVYNFNAFTSSS